MYDHRPHCPAGTVTSNQTLPSGLRSFSGRIVIWAPLLRGLQLHSKKRPRGSFTTSRQGHFLAPPGWCQRALKRQGRAAFPGRSIFFFHTDYIDLFVLQELCRRKRAKMASGRAASDTLRGRHRNPHVDTRIPNDRSIFTRSWLRWKLKESSPGRRFLPGYGVSRVSPIGYAASTMMW